MKILFCSPTNQNHVKWTIALTTNFYNVQSCSRQGGEEGGTELQNGSTLPTRELDLCQSRPLRSQTKFEPSLGSNTDTKTRGKDEGEIIDTPHVSCVQKVHLF